MPANRQLETHDAGPSSLPMVVETTHGVNQDAARTWIVRAAPPLVVRQPAELMGIINVTPDSFSDGGRLGDATSAITVGEAMIRAGAAWLDIGGESSRPGAVPVPAAEESRRVLPVIAGLRARGMVAPLSIDTTKAVVARAALDAGATAVNDISAGSDPAMFPCVAERGCPYVLMHMQGSPATMQRAPRYHDVVDEVLAFFDERLKTAHAAGVRSEALLLDPGIGFGKTPEHNLALLRALPRFTAAFARPLVIGVSRKSFIAALLGPDSTEARGAAADRDAASHVLHGLLAPHCALLRVHDVAGARAALRLAAALRTETDGGGRAV